ncbi:MAG TPA: sialidase family protein [Gaiellales bacterium]|nr:sialidase family protein [Gaiellales bacterium]
MRRALGGILAACAFAVAAGGAAAAPGADVRLSNDTGGGYVSAYTLGTGHAYTDGVLQECSIARGRQNEPALAIDPRNPSVILGSSNDYCGVYGPPGDPDTGSPAGPIWLGYYRSENGGQTFQSSLVPGYPGDTSPYAALAQIRTASSGDPVIAWDGHGRAFFGSESSEDPAGTPKGFGDEWVATYENSGGGTVNDGKRYVGTVTVAKGSSAPLTGKFNDKTAIEADRTGGTFDGNVYFAWSRFTGQDTSNIYFVRSTDHGRTFSKPKLLTPNAANLQDPRIDVTGNGHVYVTYDVGDLNNGQQSGVQIVKSTDGGKTFSSPAQIVRYTSWEESDESVAGGVNRDCGDGPDACISGYTFFRNDSTTDSSADQKDRAHEYVYLLYNASIPGSEVSTGTSYGTEGGGTGSQAGAYFVRYNGATGAHTTPKLISASTAGHQSYPDISADGGMLHTEWWDSRNDPCYSAARPIGNCADTSTVPALDVYASSSSNAGNTWTSAVKLTDVRSNGNDEQFDDRRVPFGGDYLWVSSIGSFAYSVWTDWRNTVAGTDPRETGDSDNDGADVKQCRALDPATGTYGPDTCPHAGGLDQNIYGDVSP